MSDEDRKATVQVPNASNAVLANEKLEALGKRVDGFGEKLDRILGKLEALNELREAEAKARESADGRLGRSLDRLDEKVTVLARAGGATAEEVAAVKALAMAAVDGVEALNRKLDALQKQGAESAPHAKPAE